MHLYNMVFVWAARRRYSARNDRRTRVDAREKKVKSTLLRTFAGLKFCGGRSHICLSSKYFHLESKTIIVTTVVGTYVN